MKTDDLLQESTVYTFYVPSINAIKVGFGTSGHARMRNYSRKYSLSSSAISLREWKLPSPNLASAVETACHRALLRADFCRVDHVVDESEAQELFDLGHHTYEEAVILVAEAVEETISSLYAALGKFKPLSEEKARQQKEEAQRRRTVMREEKKARKEEERNRLINAAIPEIRAGWNNEVAPFAKACDNAKAIYKNFPNEQGLFSWINYGRQSRVNRMLSWHQWPMIKKLIPEIFHAARRAKSFYCEMKKQHGDYSRQAEGRLGVSIGHALPLVGTNWDFTVQVGRDENGMAFLEVRLVVQLATGFGGDDAEQLIRRDPELIALVKFAQQNLAPELRIHP